MDTAYQAALDRVGELICVYSSPTAGAAHLLCDRHDPQAIAFTLVGADLVATELSYGELRRDSERLADALAQLGLKPGDRIATLMGKSRAYLVSVLAIWRLGAAHVPLFTAFAAPAVDYRLRASGCRLVICDAAQLHKLGAGDGAPRHGCLVVAAGASGLALGLDELLARGRPGFPAATLGGDAPIIQLYTSGTTGKPKGVVVPLRALAGFHAYLELGLGVTGEDRFWNAADPGWAYGLYFAVLAPMAAGVGNLLLDAGFAPQATFDVLEQRGITNFAAAPTVYRALRASELRPRAPLGLRRASSAGEPLTPEVNDWARQALGVEVHDHYGQTETGMIINNHQHPALSGSLRPGSMGRPMPGWAPAVLGPDDRATAAGEEGRVAVDLAASPLAWFAGYVGDPMSGADKFSADRRWYFTGDVGRVDKDGYFYFSARDDDVIIMAGYRIGPTDVESLILGHPAVAECAVIGVPDPVRGEVLEAAVVLRGDHAASVVLTAEIQDLVKQGYGAHAYPRRVHYMTSLPKTPSGKIQRFLIREQLRDAPPAALSRGA